MKMRLADYVADFLADNEISDCFTVTGGGAMFLNDAFGHHKKLHCTYCHHEQACAMAAEAYARVDNRLALVCVTTGPGATNAITGVAGAWMDSIPMLVISGQARYETTVYASGLELRTRGVQEFDIIGSVFNMTKYCQLVKEPESIRFCLEKALYLARAGRPGPCWLDIPLDVQSAIIETDDLRGYEIPEKEYRADKVQILEILKKLKEAKRPVFFAGNGIRLAGAHDLFITLAERCRVPVVTGMSSVDAIETEHPCYVGRNGMTGDRAGNFAIQCCDLLVSFGSRQSFLQTGFQHQRWAPNAYKILNDIDSQELEKDSLHADMKVCSDVGDLLKGLLEALESDRLPSYSQWLERCIYWKQNYPVVQQKHYKDRQANIYAFYHELTSRIPAHMHIVVSAGTARVAGSQASVIQKGQRFYTNPSMAAMGYDLPAAVGVCIASRKPTVLVTGDGGFQMNIQELQTIVQNRLPIAIFVMNNQGYHSIRMTQQKYFEGSMIGIGDESGDLSFPDLSRLIPAYGIAYYRIEKNEGIPAVIDQIMHSNLPCLCEVMLSGTQVTEPKVDSRKLADGRMVSGSLDDMYPFLDEKERLAILQM